MIPTSVFVFRNIVENSFKLQKQLCFLIDVNFSIKIKVEYIYYKNYNLIEYIYIV